MYLGQPASRQDRSPGALLTGRLPANQCLRVNPPRFNKTVTLSLV
jgi:hypothetical protein